MTYRLVVKAQQIQQGQISLDAQQLHYLLRVLRLEHGDRFIAFNGIGQAWLAEITDQGAQIVESIEITTELPLSLSLITALPKSNGYEQVLRCCTELGISNFIPVISDRTILKPKPNKIQRWRKIVIEAAEQSERLIVPQIFDPVAFSSAIAKTHTNQDKYICVARGDLPTLGDCLQHRTQSDRSDRSEIIIATGCEGGWTETEVKQAISSDFKPVSLGSRILRAITAPIVASSIASAVLEQKKS